MITPFDDTIRSFMVLTWPMVVICVFTLASIRITYLIKNKEEFVFYKELFHLFFLMYILCLFQIVTFEDSGTILGDGNNFEPFKEILRYRLGSRLFFKNVIGNVVLFIPYGIFASMYTKIEKPHHALGLVFFASVIVEVTQLLIGRVFDIDDIILNVCGGMIGYFVYATTDTIGAHLPKFFRSKIFLNIMSVLLVMILIGYIWMVVIK